MKVVKEDYNQLVYTTILDNGLEIHIQLFNEQVDGDMKAYIVVNPDKPLILGTVNLMSDNSVKHVLKSLKESNPEFKNVIKDETDLQNKLKEIGYIIRNKQYEIKGLKVEINEDQKTKALEFLRNKHLLERIDYIARHSSMLPFVHEYDNLLLSILVMLSSKSQFPTSIEFSSPKSTGKSYIPNRASSIFPSDMIIPLGEATGKSLYYLVSGIDDQGRRVIDLVNKCFIVFEKDQSIKFVESLKPLMSHDNCIPGKIPELTSLRTISDPEQGGEFRSKPFVIKGYPSVITLTTELPMEEQIQSRQLIASPSTEKDKISDSIKARNELSANPQNIYISPDVELLHNSMRLLQRYYVRNVFSKIFDDIFPMEVPERMRDHTKMLSIIDTITILHQEQRMKETINGFTYIYSTVEDNFMALALIDKVLRSTFTGIPRLTFQIYEKICEMENKGMRLSDEKILEYIHVDIKMNVNDLVQKHIKLLLQKGLLTQSKFFKRRGSLYNISKEEMELYRTYSLLPVFYDNVLKKFNELISVIDFEKLELPTKNFIDETTEIEKQKLKDKYGEKWEKVGNLACINYFVKGDTLIKKIINDDEVIADLCNDINPFIEGVQSTKYIKKKQEMDKIRISIQKKIFEDEINEDVLQYAQETADEDREIEEKAIGNSYNIYAGKE